MHESGSESDLPSPQFLLQNTRLEKTNKLEEVQNLDQKSKKPTDSHEHTSKETNQEDKNTSNDDKDEIAPYQSESKTKLDASSIRNLIVKCSACGKQVNHHDPNRVKRHRHLGVLVCKDCSEFYGSGNFSQDDDGDKYCRWCAQGGQVFGCDFCSNVFCTDCIRRNFGRGETRKIKDTEWKCYICDPFQLHEKVTYCEMILDYSRTAKQAKKVQKKSNQNITSYPVEDLDSKGSQPSDWFPAAFDNIAAASAKFKNKIEKLRRHALSGRSPKQIVRKLEQIVDNHKADIKGIVNKVQQKYRTYSREKLQASLSKSRVINISDDSDDNAKNSVQHVKDDVIIVNGFDAKRKLEFSDAKPTEQHSSRTETTSDNHCEVKTSGLDSTVIDQSSVQKKCVTASEKNETTSHVETGDASMECSRDLFNESLSDDIVQSTPVRNNEEKDVNDVDFNEIATQKIDEAKSPDHDVPSAIEDANASAKSTLLKNSDDSSSESETSTIPNASDAETVAKKKLKKKVKKSSSSLSDTSDSGSSDCKKKQKRLKQSKTTQQQDIDYSQYFTRDEIISREKYADDIYLKSRAVVIIEKLIVSDTKMHENMQSTVDTSDITLEVKKVENELDELKKHVAKLQKIPTGKTHVENRSNKKKTQHTVVKKKRTKSLVSSASDSFSLSSDEEDKNAVPQHSMVPTKAQLKDINHISKNTLLENDSDSASSLSVQSIDLSSEANNNAEKKPKSSKKGVAEDYTPEVTNLVSDDDSEDFVSVKRRKVDKLLKVSLADSDEAKSKDKKQKENEEKKEKKKGQKRKVIYSDDSKENNSSSSDVSSSSDSEEEKKKKQKNKKRRVKIDDSSDDADKKDDLNGSQNTPGKGRKNIRKLISDKKLTDATREAQEAEKERRKRIADRQKLYNKIVDTNTDGSEPITRKMVLEVDPDSKEEVVEIHPDVVEKLKPHQINGVKFMWECTIESLKDIQDGKPGSGCILAHCMGLGKTLQVIAFLYTVLTNKHIKGKLRTAMIISPYNTVLNWVAEFEKWLEEAEDEINIFEMASVKTSSSRRDLLEDWQREGGVLVLGYNIFARLAAGKVPRASKKVKEAIFKHLCDPGADIVVCDEGHMLKNETSFLSKAASKLKTQRRIVLTGTPLQNNLKEYHCMMSFVKPNLLGTLKEFTNRFVNPINNGQYDDSSKYDVKLMKKRVHILHKLLEGCVHRCDYSALTKFLPPKHEFVISVKLSDVQIKLYRHFLDNLARGKGGSIDGGKLFYDYNTLKSVWTHPWILFLSYYRAEKQKLMRMATSDDDSMNSFIDDDDEEAEMSASSHNSVEQLSDENNPKPGPSKKRSDNDSGDEVIRSYKTRSRGGAGTDEDDGDDLEVVDKSLANQWFTEFLTEEDKFKLEFSGKMVLVMAILRECQSIGDKILLFSQSILTLDMIEEILSHVDEQQATNNADNGLPDSYDCWEKGIDYFRMDGTTNVELRKRWIELFNDPENERARLFLISTKAGSLGTNLIGANRVIIMDASWNPSHDVQAIFRVYRFGQNKPVYIYRLLAHGTMEEKIYNRQVTKLSLSCRVVDEQQIDRHYNAAHLAELYTFEPEIDANRPTPMVPKDRLFADILMQYGDWIVKYHEHDSLLQCSTEDDLTEEERQAAWAEYENEKDAPANQPSAFDEYYNINNQRSTLDSFGFPLLSGKNIDIDKVVLFLMGEIRRRNPECTMSQLLVKCQANLMTMRNVFQVHHVQCLRSKQLLLSKGEPVPPNVSNTLLQLENSLENIGLCIQNVQLKMSCQGVNEKLQKQQQQQQQAYRFGPPPHRAWNPNATGYFIRVQSVPRASGNVGSGYNIPGAAPTRPPDIRLPPGTKFYTFSTASKEKPSFVDITNDKDSGSSNVSSAVPIVTEVDEASELNTEQPSTRKDNSVEITEID